MPTEFLWPRETPPEQYVPPAASTPVPVFQDVAGLTLRRGLITPLRRDGISDYASGTGSSLLRAHLAQILNVRASSETTSGEYPWNLEFGSLMALLRHAPMDEIDVEMARVYAADAVSRWTTLIRITGVEVHELEGDDLSTTRYVRFWFRPTKGGAANAADYLDAPLPASSR